MLLKPNFIAEPSDPYDAPAWADFYAANPGYRRSVGAQGVNDDDTGNGDEDNQTPADPEAGDDDKPKTPGAEGDDGASPKPSDKEAELLKDLMKQKEANKALKSKLSDFEKRLDGVDLEEYQALKQASVDAEEAEKKAEEKRLLDRGEFDKVKEQMLTQHQTELEAERSAKEDLAAQLAEANKTINNLTVGAEFGSSKFIANEIVYTSKTARKLYEGHFDLEDGKVVGYDKPRGEEGRAPIVDAQGNPAGFDVALQRIIDADPEKNDILLSSLKPGAGSGPGKGDVKQEKAPTSSREKISAGLGDLMKNIDKPSDGGVSF